MGLFNWCDASAEYLVDRSSSWAVDASAASARSRSARFSSESSASFFTGADMLRATKWLATNPPNNRSAPATPICQRRRCSCAVHEARGYKQIPYDDGNSDSGLIRL